MHRDQKKVLAALATFIVVKAGILVSINLTDKHYRKQMARPAA